MDEVTLSGVSPVAFAFDSHAVRTITHDDGAVWFVGADICNALAIRNSRDALARLDDDQKGVGIIDTLGGPQEMVTVNESGLYALVLTSRKPEAKQFARWVTGEVLPAIRRQGYYGGGAMAQMAQAMTQTQQVLAVVMDEVRAAREDMAAIRPLVEVAHKYIAHLEANQKPRRREHPPRPVTPELENEIRALLAQGMTGADISRLLDVSQATVSLIKNEKWTSRKAEGGAQ